MTVHELHHKDAHYSFHIRKGEKKKKGRKRLTTGLTQRAEQVRRVENQSARRVHTELFRAHSRARVHALL